MNILQGNISRITNNGNLTLVDVNVKGLLVTAIMIGNPGKVRYLKCGEPIELLFNESEVSVGKDNNGSLSVLNHLICTVEEIVTGKIFTLIHMLFQGEKIVALIPSRSVKIMELKKGDEITAYIKINEVFLKETDLS